MDKNEEFEIEITDINEEGLGIGRLDGFVFFIKDTVPGDRALCAVTRLKKYYGYARLIRILSPSPNRVKSPCALALSCGGCQLQALNYEAQLRFKEKKVQNSLERIGGFGGVEIEPVAAAKKNFRYRNKAVFPLGIGRDGRIRAGFYAARTHHIIECGDCLIGSRKNQAIVSAVIDFMEKRQIQPYDEKTGSGVFRHILIREAESGDVLVSLIINAADLKEKEELVSMLLEAEPQIKSISLNINKERNNVILGGEIKNIYGPGYIEDTLMGLEFRISANSFFQINHDQTERLYKTVIEFADLKGSENVLDLYCGVGTISLFLAQRAAKVYGVEEVPQATRDARKNALVNNIDNVSFLVGKTGDIIDKWILQKESESLNEHIDLVVLDPPRKGCDKKTLEAIIKLHPDNIIYVSCNPSTLARDLKFLCSVDQSYSLRRVRPIDMFPQTVSIETVVHLVLRKTSVNVDIDVEMEELF